MMINIPIKIKCKKCGEELEPFNFVPDSSVPGFGFVVKIEIMPCKTCLLETHKDSFARGRFAAEHGFIDKPE